MKIAIGTLRAPKIAGIQEWVVTCPYFADVVDSIEYITENVESGISHMPISIEEVMLGAQNRANNLLAAGIQADYYVGTEWGTTRIGDKSYLFGVVYVRNASGEGHFGFSPMVEVPKLVDHMLYEEWKDLGPIMGELSGRTDIRSEKGSMSAWTEDMFTRNEEFSVAFKAAIAPFYNQYYTL